nr:CDK5 and ABL1 enzyme substrate 2 [Vicugna pacos]
MALLPTLTPASAHLVLVERSPDGSGSSHIPAPAEQRQPFPGSSLLLRATHTPLASRTPRALRAWPPIPGRHGALRGSLGRPLMESQRQALDTPPTQHQLAAEESARPGSLVMQQTAWALLQEESPPLGLDHGEEELLADAKPIGCSDARRTCRAAPGVYPKAPRFPLHRRRVASQRCSLEFLEDTVGCASVQRTKHISGSPRHKGLKKTHFIKNMRQYDTKSSRIVLICAKRSLCAAFSVLPYGEGLRVSDLRGDSQKQRHPSGGISVSSEMVFQLEGVELGADGKVVSYAKFLYPTNALVTLKPDSHGPPPPPRPSVPRTLPGSRCKPAPARATPAGPELGTDAGDTLEYNPDLLDDPQWPCGKHKRVLIFASYMTTVIEYVKPSDLKKDMNETFREKFPHIKLTLSKIRSLKREMRNLSEECGLEPVTVSMAYVYFEKLVLQGKLNKQTRKLCAGACVLLAAKISSDLRRNGVKQLIDVSGRPTVPTPPCGVHPSPLTRKSPVARDTGSPQDDGTAGS